MAPYKWTSPVGSFLNPRLGISHEIRPGFHLYYSLGKTGREPTRNDLFLGNDDLLADSIGNPVLGTTQAEEVLAQELGFRLQRSHLSLSVNAYHMNFSNELVLSGQFGPNGLALHSDVAKSHRSGLEVDATYQVHPRWTLTHHAAYALHQIQEDGVRFKPILSPHVLLNQQLMYDYRDFQFILSGRYQSRVFLDFSNEHQLPGFFQLNATASKQFQRVKVSVHVNNLTNQQPWIHGQLNVYGDPTYHVLAPLHYFANVSYQF